MVIDEMPPKKINHILPHTVRSDKIYHKSKKLINEDLRGASRLIDITTSNRKIIKYSELKESMIYPMTFCSIDPGNKAMGLRIEKISKIRNSFRTDMKTFNIVQLDKSSDIYESNVIDFLEKNKVFECDVVAIERQLAVNKDMQRLESIIRTLWIARHHFLKSSKIRYFISISSKLKVRMMTDAIMDKKLMTYYVAHDILHKMKDRASQDVLKTYKEDTTTNKKLRSDLSDTVCQLYALLHSIGYVDLFK